MDINGMWRMRLENGKLRGELELPFGGAASGIGVFSNKTSFFVPYLDGVVTFTNGEQNHILQGHPVRMVSLPYHGNSAQLVGQDAVWTLDESLRIHEVRAKGASLGALSEKGWIAHLARLSSWALPPNTTAVAWKGDEILITDHLDGEIRMWNMDGTLRASFIVHEGRVSDLSVSPDSAYLASSSWDSTVAVFDLRSLYSP